MRIIIGVFLCVTLCWHSDGARVDWKDDCEGDGAGPADLTHYERQLVAQLQAVQREQEQQEQKYFDDQKQKLLDYSGNELAKLRQLFVERLQFNMLGAQKQEQLTWLMLRMRAYSNLDLDLRNTLWLLRRGLTTKEWKWRLQLEAREQQLSDLCENELRPWLKLCGREGLLPRHVFDCDNERKKWLDRLKEDLFEVDLQLRKEQCHKDLSDISGRKERVELQLEQLKHESSEILKLIEKVKQEFEIERQGLLERLELLEKQQREQQQEPLREELKREREQLQERLKREREQLQERLKREQSLCERQREWLGKQRLKTSEQARQLELELLEIQERSSDLEDQVKRKRCELSDPVKQELRRQQQLTRRLQDLRSELARRRQDGSLDPKLGDLGIGLLSEQLERSQQRQQMLLDPAKQEQVERDFARLKQRLAEQQKQWKLEWSWRRQWELGRRKQLEPYEARHLKQLQARLTPLRDDERAQLEYVRQILGDI